jgi:gamma-glutamylcyclotransferase (GGCT)/AIG2-like uncharacterized protein YtfP
MALTISRTEPTAMFVYGTLRTAAANWSADSQVGDPVTGCTAKGDLFNYGNAFPYADFDGEGTIQGDIVLLSPDGARHVQYVEEGAGYEQREVLVTLPDGSTQVVLGWQITERCKSNRSMDLIPSGDWMDIEYRVRRRGVAH